MIGPLLWIIVLLGWALIFSIILNCVAFIQLYGREVAWMRKAAKFFDPQNFNSGKRAG